MNRIANDIASDGALALSELGLARDAEVLDVGTGKGNFAIYLATEGFRVLTGEPATDKTMYAGRDWAGKAREAGVFDSIRFEAFNANQLPFEAEAFDAVFFFGVLHHIEEEVRKEVFREALRVAKSDGAVVFFEPREEMLRRVRVDDPSHPPAALPSRYLPENGPREQMIEGALMDIYIYKKCQG